MTIKIYKKGWQFLSPFFLFGNNILLLHTLAPKLMRVKMKIKEWQNIC